MKIIKNNQAVIMAIALMLVAAGYLNFIGTNEKEEIIQTASGESIGDAVLVSNDENFELEVADKKIELDEVEETSTKEIDDKIDAEQNEYFPSSKLQRDTMYSQIIESYQKMIDSETLSAEQKAIAQNEISKINNTKNSIMITENLIKSKGFEDVVILVNDESVNVILKAEELKQEEISKIQNIVSREMKSEIENIHISKR